MSDYFCDNCATVSDGDFLDSTEDTSTGFKSLVCPACKSDGLMKEMDLEFVLDFLGYFKRAFEPNEHAVKWAEAVEQVLDEQMVDPDELISDVFDAIAPMGEFPELKRI